MKKRFWFVCPQTDFIYTEEYDLLVDYVGRFETLQGSFSQICKKLDLPAIELPHLNASKTIYPRYEEYQDYYDDETVDFVSQIYEKDIELFNYTFDP